MPSITKSELDTFLAEGFVTKDSMIAPAAVAALKPAFAAVFNGQFETGVAPDEVNWQYANGDPALTRQICNGWKANRTIASTVLQESLGAAIGQLGGWSGVRVMIDNVLWKPPGARTLGYHQDSAFLSWFTPSDLITCWIALDDTTKDGGTMELVRGSHLWDLHEPKGEFHAPKDYRAPMKEAAIIQGVKPNIAYIEVPAGGGSFHHGRTWHGSGENVGEQPRRALVLHAMRADVEYVPANFAQGIGPIYSRYKRLGDNQLDENYFPIIWQEDGYRTAAIEEYCCPRVK